MDRAPGAVLTSPYLRVHQLVYQLSRGFIGRHVAGRPALLLTTRGRRSGIDRTVALIYDTPGNGSRRHRLERRV